MKILSSSMKIKTFHVKINSVRENIVGTFIETANTPTIRNYIHLYLKYFNDYFDEDLKSETINGNRIIV